MFDKFADYMWYLLPSAFKRQKKKSQFAVYCKIIGNLYDMLMQSLFRLREETILETCSHCMLEVFGNDYDMMQMKGETYESYRKRLQMKALTAEKAGTLQGILYAMASVGYDNCTITPFYLANPERWAEIRINVYTGSVDDINTIDFNCVVSEVMKVKKASTLPHYRFYYSIIIIEQKLNNIKMALRFIMSVPFWGCGAIYIGQYHYDGTIGYDAKRDYKTHSLIKSRIYLFIKQYILCRNCCIRAQVKNREEICGKAIFNYFINFWRDVRYDGMIQDNTIRRYKLKTQIRLYASIKHPCEEIGLYVETQRNVVYYDGTLRYDGSAKYDALYRKEKVE